jgi:hypothetical protein
MGTSMQHTSVIHVSYYTITIQIGHLYRDMRNSTVLARKVEDSVNVLLKAVTHLIALLPSHKISISTRSKGGGNTLNNKQCGNWTLRFNTSMSKPAILRNPQPLQLHIISCRNWKFWSISDYSLRMVCWLLITTEMVTLSSIASYSSSWSHSIRLFPSHSFVHQNLVFIRTFKKHEGSIDRDFSQQKQHDTAVLFVSTPFRSLIV